MKQNTTSLRVVSEIRARIRSGQLAAGQCVPSARAIVREWNVALATATKVHGLLKREGLVQTKPGVGTIVRGERAIDLTPERIVQTAIGIADDEGTAGLTLRLLARELGVATSSVQWHVHSVDALWLAMADACLGETPPPPRGRGTWRARLEALARLQWASYRRHPWLASVISITRPQLLPHGMRHTEAILAALCELGLEAENTLRLGVSLLAMVRGLAVALETEGQARQDTGLDSDQWHAANEAAFAGPLSAFPTLARLGAIDVPLDLDALFECNLAVFLDGLKARTRRQ